VTKSSEPGKVFIPNSNGAQGVGESVEVKLRIVARPWHCPDIDNPLNPVGLEKIDKNLKGSCRMTNRQDEGCLLMSFRRLIVLLFPHSQPILEDSAISLFENFLFQKGGCPLLYQENPPDGRSFG
jgi:hypothetical protein